jgi:hypothetical protein
VEEAGTALGYARYVVLNVGEFLVRVSSFGYFKFELKLELILAPKLTTFTKQSNESIIFLLSKFV